MYNIVKTVIEAGRFDLTGIIRKVNTLWFEGKLSDEEKADLVAMAQGKANPQNSVDLMTKLAELEQRVKALESKGNTATEGEEVTEETYEPFVEGKWYYNGDKVSFEGNNYTCIAPEGTVCVWSPLAYPDYWVKETI